MASNVAFGNHHRHQLDVYGPRRMDEPAPVLLFIYGGGWDSGSKTDYDFIGHAFAAAGFVCVIADYRIVPDAHFPDFVEDGAAALRWVLDNIADFWGDASQIFLVGHSAGAYNAVMLGLDGARFGVPDLAGRVRGVVGLSGPYDFYPFDVAASVAAFSQATEPTLTQPINLVKRDAPPMFLGHGSRDQICLPRNTVALAKGLRQAEVKVIERYYAGLGHPEMLLSLFPLLRWRAPVFQEVLAFMRGELDDP